MTVVNNVLVYADVVWKDVYNWSLNRMIRWKELLKKSENICYTRDNSLQHINYTYVII